MAAFRTARGTVRISWRVRSHRQPWSLFDGASEGSLSSVVPSHIEGLVPPSLSEHSHKCGTEDRQIIAASEGGKTKWE